MGEISISTSKNAVLPILAATVLCGRSEIQNCPDLSDVAVSCHILRHTFCTRFCENETNLKVIQEIMGHADISTTMDVYAEATQEKKKESMTSLQSALLVR